VYFNELVEPCQGEEKICAITDLHYPERESGEVLHPGSDLGRPGSQLDDFLEDATS
jgi:hypothetical protein